MSKTPSENVLRAWARLMRAQRVALATVERELKQAGLPALIWYDALLEVERAGAEGLRPFELERAMLMAQYNLSRLLDRIEQAGLIVRRAHETDGRGQTVAITEQGRAMRRRMWPVYAAAIEEALGARLSEAEAATLDALLGKVISAEKA